MECEHSHAAGGSPPLPSASQSAPYTHRHRCRSHQASPQPMEPHFRQRVVTGAGKVSCSCFLSGHFSSRYRFILTVNKTIQNKLKRFISYLHHGDSGVNLWRERNMDLILVPVNTGGARVCFIMIDMIKCDDMTGTYYTFNNHQASLTQLSCPPQCQSGPPGRSGPPQTWQTVWHWWCILDPLSLRWWSLCICEEGKQSVDYGKAFMCKWGGQGNVLMN